MEYMSRLQHRNTNSPRDHPKTLKRFYAIVDNEDGTVDIHLEPVVTIYRTEDGIKEMDARVCIVRGINPDDPAFGGDLEAHIRAHFSAWMEIGEVIDL